MPNEGEVSVVNGYAK